MLTLAEDFSTFSEENLRLAARCMADGPSYFYFKQLPDGSLACICRFMFTYAILSGLNDCGYEDRWCYHNEILAMRCLDQWIDHFDDQKEPIGWHRHPLSGRRVNEDTGEIYINR
jgi:hypothetical protein